jgi:integrase/recombinase XerD
LSSKHCKSTNPLACDNKRHPCPIWVRGATPNGGYVEKSLKSLTGTITRDWAKANEAIQTWEKNGKAPRPATARTTIAQWKDAYLTLAESNNLSTETVRKYRHLFRQLENFAADKGIRFVDEFDLQMTTEFRLSWNNGALTTSKKLAYLRSFMKFAVERDWLTKNPALSLKVPKVKANPTLPFSQDEMAKILRAAKPNQRVYTFILVMRSSGLRISDVAKLAVESLKGNRLSLHQAKTGQHVSILLDQSVADALRAVQPLNRNPKYFFWTGESKLQSVVSNWRKWIAEVFIAAGIVNGHTHRFRDTFAVALLERGVAIETVSRLLGHSSIKITEKHYNPWARSRQDAMDTALEDANGWLRELESSPHSKVLKLGSKH